MKEKFLAKVERIYYGKVDKCFYEENQSLLDDANYSMVLAFYCCAVIIFSLLLAVSFVVSSFEASSTLYGIIVFTLFIGALLVKYIGDGKRNLVSFFYYFAAVIIIAYSVYAGTFNNATGNTIGVILVLVVLPVLFIDKPGNSLFMCILSLIAFLICSFIVKSDSPRLFAVDVLNSCAAFAFGIFLIRYTRDLLLENIQAKLVFQAQSQIDKLTGAYNKAQTETLCREYIQDAGSRCACALIALDVDDFKHVNDTLGHMQGDEVLRQVGINLRRVFRDDDIVGRIGGDEFVILMKKTADTDIIEKQAELINRAIGQVFEEQMETKMSCSIGISVANHERATYEAMFSNADKALYYSKRTGRGKFTFYDDTIAPPENA